MRLTGGLLGFAAAALLSFGGVWIANVVRPYLVLPEIDIAGPEPEVARMPKGVEVLFAGPGWNADRKERFLMFFVYNGGHEPLHYIGYSAEHSFPRLRANGMDLPDTYICSMGASRYTIPPGRTAELHIYREEFLNRPPKNTLISAGFRLRPESAEEPTFRYSQPFQMPEEFRKAIKEN